MNDIDINLERFANFMADMIEKYGAEIDLSELDDAKAETSVSASFFCVYGEMVGKMFLDCKTSKYFGIFQQKRVYKKAK